MPSPPQPTWAVGTGREAGGVHGREAGEMAHHATQQRTNSPPTATPLFRAPRVAQLAGAGSPEDVPLIGCVPYYTYFPHRWWPSATP